MYGYVCYNIETIENGFCNSNSKIRKNQQQYAGIGHPLTAQAITNVATILYIQPKQTL